MDPITALAAAFVAAFSYVGMKLGEKIVEAHIEPLVDQYKEFSQKPYQEAKELAHVREALQQALAQLKQDQKITSEDQLLASLRLANLPDESMRLAAASVIEMRNLAPKKIPGNLLSSMNLGENERDLLARFFLYFRQALAQKEKYDRLISYANQMEVNGKLDGFGEDLAKIFDESKRAASWLELLARDRRLTIDDKQALDQYLEICRKQWGNIKLPMVRKGGGEIVQDRLKFIYVPLTLRDLAAEEKARKIAARAKQATTKPDSEEVKPIQLEELLRKYPAFVMTGTAGSGKTTLLRRAALAFAEGYAAEELSWQGKALLPIFLRLRNFGTFLEAHKQKYSVPGHGALIAYLEDYYRNTQRLSLPPDFFDYRLKEGRCLVLLDGLDEVTENRVEVAQQVNAFICEYKRYPGNQFGLSARPSGYDQDAKLQLVEAGLSQVVVNPLDPAGIRKLLTHLFPIVGNVEQTTAQDVDKLTQRILNSPDLTDIAGTPLFCSALVQLYIRHSTDLPEKRVAVLAELVDLLLGYWYAQQGLEMAAADRLAKEDGTPKATERKINVAVDTKLNRLSHLAFYMQAESKKAEIAKPEAEKVIATFLFEKEKSARDLDTAVQWAKSFLENTHDHSGLMAELDLGTYAFLHKGFMEYLAALALLDLGPIADSILQYIEDEWWEEVVLLAVAHTGPTWQHKAVIQKMLEKLSELLRGSESWSRHLIMLGKMARDIGGNLPGAEHEAVENYLHTAAVEIEIEPPTRAAAADALDELGYLPQGLYDFVRLEGFKEPLAIGRFPVTNEQYRRFLDDKEFAEERFWTGFAKYDHNQKLIGNWGSQGFGWLKSALNDSALSPDGKRVYPRYWHDPRYGIPRRGAPVVGLTWYEANAYCKWLGEKWGALQEGQRNPGAIPVLARLPLESEWITAAGGDDPRERYPWDQPGEKPTTAVAEIIARANVSESGINRTTPVWMFPAGQSPLQVWDLGGNVWEWQANYWSDSAQFLALRGGSWHLDLNYARLSGRNINHPDSEWLNGGFRVVVVFPK